jgi:hypothetical protein
MISRPLGKIREFSTSFEFYIIFYLSTTRSSSWYENQMQENCASFQHGLRDVSWTWIPFLNKFALWFYALAVHIRRIRIKYKERSEIGKYSKQRQNGANFEHVLRMSVCGSRKKFGLENVKFFLENLPWADTKHSPKMQCSRWKCPPRHVYFFTESHICLVLGESNGRRRPLRLCWWRRQLNPSPRAESRKLSTKGLFTVGQRFAESHTMCSRRREASPRAGVLALGEAPDSRWRLGFW